MIKKTITFTNLDGEEETQDYYFRLTKGEIILMEASSKEPFEQKLKRIVASDDRAEIIKVFKELIGMSYGEREVVEGRPRFIKSKVRTDDFMASEACSELLYELFTKDGAAVEFFNGLLPQDLNQDKPEVITS